MMRKFPRPSHTEPLFDSTGVSILVMILCTVCPPIGVIFILIYGGYKDHKDGLESITDALYIILIIGAFFILPPILTIISIINGMFVNDFIEFLPIYFIGFVDIFFAILYSISRIFPKAYNKIHDVFCALKKELVILGYIICIIGLFISCSVLKNEGLSDNSLSYIFFINLFAIPLLSKIKKLLESNTEK